MRLVLCALLVALCVPARAADMCMSLPQARAAFPGRYLSWHGNHCWYAGRHRVGARDRAAERPQIPITPAPSPLAAVRYYPRAFDQVDALDPPLVVSVIEYRWPGNNVLFDLDQLMESSR
jgi:hypothetical protein